MKARVVHHDILDIERVRRNWERAKSPVPEDRADRLADVRAPRDPHAWGTDLTVQLRREVFAQFPERQEMLEPFLARIEWLMSKMSKRGESLATKEDKPEDDREAFMGALRDLEDLCEALSGMGR